MARKQQRRVKDEEVEPLPSTLQALQQRAKDNQQPILENGMFGSAVGKAMELLSPSEIPHEDGQGKVKRIWREPMLMVFWDRSSGAWRWTITDKAIGVAVRGTVSDLVALVEVIAAQIAEGKVEVRAVEAKRR